MKIYFWSNMAKEKRSLCSIESRVSRAVQCQGLHTHVDLAQYNAAKGPMSVFLHVVSYLLRYFSCASRNDLRARSPKSILFFENRVFLFAFPGVSTSSKESLFNIFYSFIFKRISQRLRTFFLMFCHYHYHCYLKNNYYCYQRRHHYLHNLLQSTCKLFFLIIITNIFITLIIIAAVPSLMLMAEC